MNADLALRIVEAINDRDRSLIGQLCAPGVQLRLPPGRVFYGPDGVNEFFNELEALVPDLTLIASKVWRGEGFIVVEWESAGSTSLGKQDSMGAFVIEMDGDGKVERVQLYLDTMQWAAIHTPPSAGSSR